MQIVFIFHIGSHEADYPQTEEQLFSYLGLSPQQSFDESAQNPELIQKAISGMKPLNEDDLLMLLGIINRLLKEYTARSTGRMAACA